MLAAGATKPQDGGLLLHCALGITFLSNVTLSPGGQADHDDAYLCVFGLDTAAVSGVSSGHHLGAWLQRVARLARAGWRSTRGRAARNGVSGQMRGRVRDGLKRSVHEVEEI